MLVAHLGDDAVVVDIAGFGQHEAVADAARLQRRDRLVGVEIDQGARLRPEHLDLAERRAVEHADAVARALGFNQDRLGAAAVPGRAQPAAVFAKHRTEAAVLGLQRQAAHGVEQFRPTPPGDHLQRHGRRRAGDRW